MSQNLKLAFADSRQWVIRPLDDAAAAIVAALGKVMRLGPACEAGRPVTEDRELCVAVSDDSDTSVLSDAEMDGPVVCRVAAPTNRDLLTAQMMRITETVAREALARGGLLLHAALAEHQGSGFGMAGPGTVGKSTASNRLPSPWRSLCDDMTLAVRDAKGRYWAHPWPTWSRFWSDGPGGSWPVEQAVPLRAIFFLGQAPSDKLEPVNPTQATALILESAVDLVREASLMSDVNAARALVGEGVSAAKAVALAVPAYSLKLSLDGRFWEEIERVLPKTGDGGPGAADQGPETGERFPSPVAPAQVSAHGSLPESSHFADGSLRVVCTGVSMRPTLDEPDLLEVRPYGPRRVRRGDVVCFKSPDTGRTVVHRVVSVGRPGTRDGRPTDGIRTRGDNNLNDDPWVLQAGDVIGWVAAAQRGARRRAIASGWQGLVGLGCVRLGRRIRRSAGLVPHTLYDFAAGLGPFDYLLPRSLRARLARFDARHRVFLKLLIGGHEVGQYDFRLKRWEIQRPFRLFVDPQALPAPKR